MSERLQDSFLSLNVINNARSMQTCRNETPLNPKRCWRMMSNVERNCFAVFQKHRYLFLRWWKNNSCACIINVWWLHLCRNMLGQHMLNLFKQMFYWLKMLRGFAWIGKTYILRGIVLLSMRVLTQYINVWNVKHIYEFWYICQAVWCISFLKRYF